MTTITTTEFMAHPAKYFNLVGKKPFAIKRGRKFFELIAKEEKKFENPSPSGDTWWDIPENRKEMERRFKEMDEGKTQFMHLTREDLRKVMGL